MVMRHELVFTVGPGLATPAGRITLAQAGLKERADLQEWIREHPQILGEDVRIITCEFDRWISETRKVSDRLDLLGLDPDGRLVLAELKRDEAPESVVAQAVRYAAYASRFTPEALGACYGNYLRGLGEDIGNDAALAILDEHCGGLDAETLRSPRIVLVAGEFIEQVTASIVWLCEQGLDITLIQTAAYQSENDIVLTASQLWPLPTVEEFTIAPRVVEPRAGSRRTRVSRTGRNTVATLVDGDVLADGTVLSLRPNGSYTGAVRSWIEANSELATAIWHPDHATNVLEWNGERWSASGLAEHIVQLAAPDAESSLNGAIWWETSDGLTLTELAGVGTRGRDWTSLHALLKQVRPGEWVSYKTLSDVIGSSPIAVGRHVATCTLCENGWRVMGVNGASREGFHFVAPDDERSQMEVLVAEGVRFNGTYADLTLEVSGDEIAKRVSATSS